MWPGRRKNQWTLKAGLHKIIEAGEQKRKKKKKNEQNLRDLWTSQTTYAVPEGKVIEKEAECLFKETMAQTSQIREERWIYKFKKLNTKSESWKQQKKSNLSHAMITTEKLSIAYTQREMERKSTHVTTKKINETWRKTAREEQREKKDEKAARQKTEQKWQ